MKYLETHFEDYVNKSNTLHPKLMKLYKKFPSKLTALKNVIFYGPAGVGKYTQMLLSIKKYSPSELKYEKKLTVTYNKLPYYFKISDIHYEIDMSLLGCISKLLWHEIYLQFIDAISIKPDKTGIIVCKNFHEIHNELLENFYSYMQYSPDINIIFILISEEISFIPENILNCCEVIHVPRPTKTQFNKCFGQKTMSHNIGINSITNIKNIHSPDVIVSHKFICDKIIESMINIDELTFLKFRDLLYDVFIYNLNVPNCIWYILINLINTGKIRPKDLSKTLVKTFTFFQYFNNNYRPICHIENYAFFLISLIHGY
jgi:hypothetical protein